MGSCNEVFERVEQKYLINPAQNAALRRELQHTHELDAYGKTTVTSVYWDTPGFDVIARSLEKPTYKEKLRARAYGRSASKALVSVLECDGRAEGIPAQDQAWPVFLELKKKLEGTVYKRRIVLSLGALAAFLAGSPLAEAARLWPLEDSAAQAQCLSARSEQISREIRAYLRRASDSGLAPAMVIACEREAFAARPGCPKPWEALRVTFDGNLRARCLTRGCKGRWFSVGMPSRPSECSRNRAGS